MTWKLSWPKMLLPAWAACGKDPGMSPLLILNELTRHTHYQENELGELRLAQPVNLLELKLRWIKLMRQSERLIESLPTEEVGCLYLDATGRPLTPNPSDSDFSRPIRHYGTLRGSWPRAVQPDSAE